jgi:hypothetical protein
MYENIIMGAGGVAQVWSTCLANRRLNPSTAKKKKSIMKPFFGIINIC